MNRKKCDSRCKTDSDQRGAALVTVVFISLLLLTAAAAMLTAVGSSSRNTTDFLSETKAYYAAETGIQAAINVLRNASPSPSGTPYTYSSFIANPNLSNWLTYSGVPSQVAVGTDTGYSIALSNPDNGAVTYSTAGEFTNAVDGVPDGNRLCIPDCVTVDAGTGNWTKITISGTGGSPTAPNTLVGTFTVLNGPDGAANTALTNAAFRIDYRILTPRVGVASVYGRIDNPTEPFDVSFQSPEYRLLGNTIRLCSSQNTGAPCPVVRLSISDVTPLAERQFFVRSSPSFSPEPYRLVLTSAGYGPNGSKKTLEGIVQRNLFGGFDPPATMSLIGPHNDAHGGTFLYDPGSSSGATYSGGNCAARCIPSFAVSDVNPAQAQLNLNDINTANAVLATPPTPDSQLVVMDNLPSWLQSPAALDSVIDRLRVTAQHSNRYFTGGATITNPGNNATGTGITFCEGSCSVKGVGGGLLVVTGQATAIGGFDFKGLIIVTGRGGWARNGVGNGSILGAIILAPYNQTPYVPENLSSTFLAPSYDMSGGGDSDVTTTDINLFIDNSLAVSDIVVGVAEK